VGSLWDWVMAVLLYVPIYLKSRKAELQDILMAGKWHVHGMAGFWFLVENPNSVVVLLR